jgi:hypothetical protein
MCSNCPRAACALCGLTRIHTRIPIQQKIYGKNSSFNIFSDFKIMFDGLSNFYYRNKISKSVFFEKSKKNKMLNKRNLLTNNRNKFQSQNKGQIIFEQNIQFLPLCTATPSYQQTWTLFVRDGDISRTMTSRGHFFSK